MSASLASFSAVMLAATSFAVACGGGGDTANRLTLTNDTCTYAGDTSTSASDTFEAELVNDSSALGAFEIAKIDAGHTFAEVARYVESERQRIAEGLPIAGAPTFMTLGSRAQVEPGASGTLVSSVAAGAWVLWCAQNHPPTDVFLIEPALEISD
jgi:hypothetical protein